MKNKKDDQQLCIYYQGLNQATVERRYALPLFPSVVEQLLQVTVFTKLDLSSTSRKEMS